MRAAVAAAVKATAGVAAVVVDADVADGAGNGFAAVDWTSFEETFAVESATSMVGEVARRRARKELEIYLGCDVVHVFTVTPRYI